MSWSTELFCNVSYNRKSYKNRYEVEEEINDIKKYINRCKKSIRDLVIMTEPNKFCPKENDPIIWITNEVEDLLNIVEESTIELYKLELLLDNWDNCHDKDGKPINSPDNIEWNTAYIDGDFIND